MPIPTPANLTSQAIAKRALWLAFQAAQPAGLGFLHVSAAAKLTEDLIWTQWRQNARGFVVEADYIAGRMMKLYFEYSQDELRIPDVPCRIDYQSWCGVYPTHAALINAAIASLS